MPDESRPAGWRVLRPERSAVGRGRVCGRRSTAARSRNLLAGVQIAGDGTGAGLCVDRRAAGTRARPVCRARAAAPADRDARAVAAGAGRADHPRAANGGATRAAGDPVAPAQFPGAGGDSCSGGVGDAHRWPVRLLPDPVVRHRARQRPGRCGDPPAHVPDGLPAQRSARRCGPDQEPTRAGDLAGRAVDRRGNARRPGQVHVRAWVAGRRRPRRSAPTGRSTHVLRRHGCRGRTRDRGAVPLVCRFGSGTPSPAAQAGEFARGPA